MKKTKKEHKTQKKHQKKKNTNNTAIYITITVLAIAIIILLSQNMQHTEQETTPKNQQQTRDAEEPISDNQILNNLKNFPELKPYATYDTKLTHLTGDDLKTLAEKQPVIYADLEGKSLYRIEYTSTTDGYLVIYDTENDRILKQFRILNMQLNN